MIAQATIRLLHAGDQAALEAFLLPRLESSMFLLGNMRSAGLKDGGQRFQGTYAAALVAGEVAAVAAHYWNGMLVLQAPAYVAQVARAAVEASGRKLGGLIGPEEQVAAACQVLAVDPVALKMDETEHLYRLDLAALRLPEALVSGQVRARRVEPPDLELMTRWRVEYSVESLGDEENPQLWESCQASVERATVDGRIWLLEAGGRPVATSAFNAATREAVQVGGVWTPVALRGRGYARAVVAASLHDARADGARLAILFTGQKNLPAQRAYEAIGFQRAGGYRLTMLREEG